MNSVKLNNGIEMPQMGYGVYQIAPDACERHVAEALSAGYRMIDTAQAYHNEEGVGRAVADSGVKRDEIFLVSKVWISNYGYDKAKASIEESLRRLRTDYIDLMLLHQPFCDRYGAYRALQDAYRGGKGESHRSVELLSRPLHRPCRKHGRGSDGESGGDPCVLPAEGGSEGDAGIRHEDDVVGTACRGAQQLLPQRNSRRHCLASRQNHCTGGAALAAAARRDNHSQVDPRGADEGEHRHFRLHAHRG